MVFNQDYLNVKFKDTGHSNMYFPQVCCVFFIFVLLLLLFYLNFLICLAYKFTFNSRMYVTPP